MPRSATRGRRGVAAIPAFALYGDAGPGEVDVLHVESLQSRSRLYRWEIDAHVHQGLSQVLWLDAGAATVELDGRRQPCDGPAAILIPPGVVHAFRFAPESVGHVLTLSARALVEGETLATAQALGLSLEAATILHFSIDEGRRLGSLFSQLADEFLALGAQGSPVLVWLARALVWRLGQAHVRQVRAEGVVAKGQQALFTRFLTLIESHYTEHWPVSRYASRLGLSTERLNRLVRSEAGRSALDLVHERVAREACRRLMYVAAPISRVAFELGFEDPAYFCRFFKRRVGASPREFRRRPT